ncbi:hypothetical protein NECAME_09400 [Necator americanus]|uniref:Uncharacterized protein n=1 Tax=Necator americanus TaxID=51031 RepID=W2TE58_NECAM|nr:hypothetical protein NECAME_09400 [Necator americanus]ETN80128.1 hypothetical protein NECAME_09400 [Necator americanus]
MTKEEICDYVNYHDDICEGGGYLLWSQYVECQFDIGKKGVTFMAFGNGAPDIFGSIASVLSSPKPKAGLALGELFEKVTGKQRQKQTEQRIIEARE